MAGKGGGAWKVAYADFVTAMMAFFMVMWIVAQNKDTKEAVSAYFRDPFGDASRPSGTGNKEGSELKVKPPPETKDKGGEKVPVLKMLLDRHGTPVGTYIQFADDSTTIDLTTQRKLKEFISLALGKQNKIEVRGHTARRAKTTVDEKYDPWQLCFARANATMEYLVANGIDPSRIRLSQAGSHEPAVGPETANWRQRNSRVEIIMLNEYVDDFSVSRGRRLFDAVDEMEKHDEHGQDHAEPATAGH